MINTASIARVTFGLAVTFVLCWMVHTIGAWLEAVRVATIG